MTNIKDIIAREVLDSRGNPTVEVDVLTDTGKLGRAMVPSGASTGAREAIELRDQNDRFLGKGVQQAVQNVELLIKPTLCGKDIFDQEAIDQCLIDIDGTDNKSKVGANAILGVSMAVAVAAANEKGQALYAHLTHLFGADVQPVMPLPMMNIMNGGAHANNSLDIQEFMIIPHNVASLKESVRVGAEIFQYLRKGLNKLGHSIAVGDEGGFAPNLNSNEEALALISTAIEDAGYVVGKDVCFALDVAASEIYKDGKYVFTGEKMTRNRSELIDYYERLVSTYPIVSIEDGFAEDDWESWEECTARLGSTCQLVGDDLFVTNPSILKKGIQKQCANAILIKLNQIGTLSETFEAIKIAQQAGYRVVISHRSGETEDSFIADLAVATGAGQIKTGSLSRADRTAKYNQLIRIEEFADGEISFSGNIFHEKVV